MSTLQYKEYQGSVTFEDGALLIQILHIDDCITTTCDCASGAPAAFAELVDDYIETCAAVGKEPSKPFKGSFNVRIGTALHKNAALAAAERGETLNSWIAGAVDFRLRRDQLLKSMKDFRFVETWVTKANQTPTPFVYTAHSNVEQRLSGVEIHGYQTHAAIARATRMAETVPDITEWHPAPDQYN
jgi:predicted HicB family RNase H-like nuclease